MTKADQWMVAPTAIERNGVDDPDRDRQTSIRPYAAQREALSQQVTQKKLRHQ